MAQSLNNDLITRSHPVYEHWRLPIKEVEFQPRHLHFNRYKETNWNSCKDYRLGT